MPRKPRKIYPNAWYHVMNRGAGRRYILKSKKHKAMFLTLLEEAATLFDVEIHAYCLMGNHYHLLLKTPCANISDFMQHVICLYTKRFNKLCRSDGPIFRSRYKAIHVNGVNYLQRVHRYIHLNPVKAKIVEEPCQYEWSSCKAYFDEECAPTWLQISECMDYLGGEKIYREYLSDGIDHETLQFYSRQLIANYYGDKLDASIPGLIAQTHFVRDSHEMNSPKLPFKEFIEKAIGLLGISTDDLFTPKSRNKNRCVMIYALRYQGGYSLDEISEYFGIQKKSTLSQRLTRVARKIEKDDEYAKLYEELKG